MSASNSCPCKDCVPPKRHPACWGSCKEFTDFNEERLRVKRETKNAKNQEAMIDSYVISQSNKYQHKKPTEHEHRRK